MPFLKSSDSLNKHHFPWHHFHVALPSMSQKWHLWMEQKSQRELWKCWPAMAAQDTAMMLATEASFCQASSPFRCEMRIRESAHIGFRVLWRWTKGNSHSDPYAKKGQTFFHFWNIRLCKKCVTKALSSFLWHIWIFITFRNLGLEWIRR